MSSGLSDSPWPSRSTVITRFPRAAISGASRSYMRRFMSSPWIEDEHPVALAVDLVGDAVAAVAEGAVGVSHDGSGVYLSPAGAGAGAEAASGAPAPTAARPAARPARRVSRGPC